MLEIKYGCIPNNKLRKTEALSKDTEKYTKKDM